jgi:hypothetical protein
MNLLEQRHFLPLQEMSQERFCHHDSWTEMRLYLHPVGIHLDQGHVHLRIFSLHLADGVACPQVLVQVGKTSDSYKPLARFNNVHRKRSLNIA